MKTLFAIAILFLMSNSAIAANYNDSYHVYGYGQDDSDAHADMITKAKGYIAADKADCLKQNGQFSFKEDFFGCDARPSRGIFYCVEGVDIQCTVN
jgi:hypothetical protein